MGPNTNNRFITDLLERQSIAFERKMRVEPEGAILFVDRNLSSFLRFNVRKNLDHLEKRSHQVEKNLHFHLLRIVA